MEATSEKGGLYSAAELAALKLPGFPTTDRAARTRAEAEGWPFVVVKSRGAKGETKKFRPPVEIQELIARAVQGTGARSMFSTCPCYPVKCSARTSYGIAEPGPYNSDAEINAHLFWLCHEACLQVYGEAFGKVSVHVQIDYAVDLYNLLLRLSAAKRGNARSDPDDFKGLDAEDMGAQLQIFLQIGWAKSFPPPNSDQNQLIF